MLQCRIIYYYCIKFVIFYLATKGGGEFFGNVGSFEKDYEFDAVVIDDSTLKHPQELDLKSRLERLIYLAEDRNIVAKFIDGKKILEKYNTPVLELV